MSCREPDCILARLFGQTGSLKQPVSVSAGWRSVILWCKPFAGPRQAYRDQRACMQHDFGRPLGRVLCSKNVCCPSHSRTRGAHKHTHTHMHAHTRTGIHTCARTCTHTHAQTLSISVFVSFSVCLSVSLSPSLSLSLSHTHTHTHTRTQSYVDNTGTGGGEGLVITKSVVTESKWGADTRVVWSLWLGRAIRTSCRRTRPSAPLVAATLCN